MIMNTESERGLNMTFEELIEYLDKNHIEYERCIDWETGEESNCVEMYACQFCHPINSYGTWDYEDRESNYEEDYELSEEIQVLFEYIDDMIFIIDCPDCCGCGDW